MGVGKSTVGRRLAKRLGLAFIDSDSAIEDAVGLPAAKCSSAMARPITATASGGSSPA
jgi:shikimate kinase